VVAAALSTETVLKQIIVKLDCIENKVDRFENRTEIA